MTPGPVHQQERLYFVDWLRIGAFGLLVPFHVGMLFVTWDFHVKSATTYAALEPWMRLTTPWRMSLLFVISGLATGLVLGRAGLARERSRRLLLPLLLGMAVIVPPQAYLEVRQKLGYAGGYLDFLRLYLGAYHGFCGARGCLVLPTWNHLWFLPYLWVYTMALLAARRWLPRAPLRRLEDALAGLSGWRLVIWPIAFLGLVRVLLYGRSGPTHALVDDAFSHATYLPLFLFGVLLARRRVLLERMQALRWPALAAALASWLALNAYMAAADGWAGVPDAWRLSMRLVHAVTQWSALVAALGFARRHLDVDHRWRAPLTEAVFPLYIVHQTIILLAWAALRRLALPAPAEAALLVAVTFAGGLAAWRLARRWPALRPWMGMTRRRELPQAARASSMARSTS